MRRKRDHMKLCERFEENDTLVVYSCELCLLENRTDNEVPMGPKCCTKLSDWEWKR